MGLSDDGLTLLVEIYRLGGGCHLFADYNLLREAHHSTYNHSQTYLSHNLELTLQAIFVVAEGLDVVVQKTERTEPNGRDNHQLNVDVVQLADQNNRNQHRKQNQHTAHRGSAFLRELTL